MKLSTALSGILSILLAASPITEAQRSCFIHPDPHFKTFGEQYYDYHGGCKLVVAKTDLINFQIETAAYGGFAGINRAALQVNPQDGGPSQILEIKPPHGDYLVDGVAPLAEPATIGGLPFTITPQGTATDYMVELPSSNGGNYFIRIRSSQSASMTQGNLVVTIVANLENFVNTEGMCGSFTGGLIGRDGTTSFDNLAIAGPSGFGLENVAFGEEWAVNTNIDGQIFSSPSDNDECVESCSFTSTQPVTRRKLTSSTRKYRRNAKGNEGESSYVYPEFETCDAGSTRKLTTATADDEGRRMQVECGCDGSGLSTPEAQDAFERNCQYDADTVQACSFSEVYMELETDVYVDPLVVSNACGTITEGSQCQQMGGTCEVECDSVTNTCTENLCDLPNPNFVPSGREMKAKAAKAPKAPKAAKAAKAPKAPKTPEPAPEPETIASGCICAIPIPERK